MIRIGGDMLLSAKRRAYFLQMYCDRHGRCLSRYFSKILGSGVHLTLLSRPMNRTSFCSGCLCAPSLYLSLMLASAALLGSVSLAACLAVSMCMGKNHAIVSTPHLESRPCHEPGLPLKWAVLQVFPSVGEELKENP